SSSPRGEAEDPSVQSRDVHADTQNMLGSSLDVQVYPIPPEQKVMIVDREGQGYGTATPSTLGRLHLLLSTLDETKKIELEVPEETLFNNSVWIRPPMVYWSVLDDTEDQEQFFLFARTLANSDQIFETHLHTSEYALTSSHAVSLFFVNEDYVVATHNSPMSLQTLAHVLNRYTLEKLRTIELKTGWDFQNPNKQSVRALVPFGAVLERGSLDKDLEGLYWLQSPTLLEGSEPRVYKMSNTTAKASTVYISHDSLLFAALLFDKSMNIWQFKDASAAPWIRLQTDLEFPSWEPFARYQAWPHSQATNLGLSENQVFSFYVNVSAIESCSWEFLLGREEVQRGEFHVSVVNRKQLYCLQTRSASHCSSRLVVEKFLMSQGRPTVSLIVVEPNNVHVKIFQVGVITEEDRPSDIIFRGLTGESYYSLPLSR
ncbi:hypothetical protein EBZ37_12925, partial [bacterium]|nr:hypothetical protein [bacterium]